MDRKLDVNKDYYPTSALEVAYILLRLGGKAASFTINRSRRGAKRHYTSTNDLFNHLRSAYEDTNRRPSAKLQYNNLSIGSILFRNFYTEFSRLGDITSLPKTQL